MSAPSLLGVLSSVASSLLWGWYPVLSRYLQTREASPISTVACLAALTSLDTILLLLYIRVQAHSGAAPRMRTPEQTSKRKRFALGYGTLCVARMYTNFQSCAWTSAFNIQLTALLLPFVTACMAKAWLDEKIHWALPPTLVASVIASMLAIAGPALTATDGASSTATWSDAAGISLQLVSVVCSAAVKIALKGTEGVLDKAELMLAQMVATAVIMLPAALAFDRASLAALTRLDGAGIACFLGLSIGIYIVANVTQIVATRAIGASNHSASNSLRLISACVGSWLVLDEPVDRPLQWVGLALIVVALSAYWALRTERAKRALARTSEQAALGLVRPSDHSTAPLGEAATATASGGVRLATSPGKEPPRDVDAKAGIHHGGKAAMCSKSGGMKTRYARLAELSGAAV